MFINLGQGAHPMGDPYLLVRVLCEGVGRSLPTADSFRALNMATSIGQITQDSWGLIREGMSTEELARQILEAKIQTHRSMNIPLANLSEFAKTHLSEQLAMELDLDLGRAGDPEIWYPINYILAPMEREEAMGAAHLTEAFENAGFIEPGKVQRGSSRMDFFANFIRARGEAMGLAMDDATVSRLLTRYLRADGNSKVNFLVHLDNRAAEPATHLNHLTDGAGQTFDFQSPHLEVTDELLSLTSITKPYRPEPEFLEGGFEAITLQDIERLRVEWVRGLSLLPGSLDLSQVRTQDDFAVALFDARVRTLEALRGYFAISKDTLDPRVEDLAKNVLKRALRTGMGPGLGDPEVISDLLDPMILPMSEAQKMQMATLIEDLEEVGHLPMGWVKVDPSKSLFGMLKDIIDLHSLHLDVDDNLAQGGLEFALIESYAKAVTDNIDRFDIYNDVKAGARIRDQQEAGQVHLANTLRKNFNTGGPDFESTRDIHGFLEGRTGFRDPNEPELGN